MGRSCHGSADPSVNFQDEVRGRGLSTRSIAHASMSFAASQTGRRVDRRLRSCCRWHAPAPAHKPHGERGGLTRPIPEGRAEAVNSDVVRLHAPQLHGHRHPRQRLASGGPGKTKSPVRVSFKAVRMATARSGSGTRCSFPAFMRLAGNDPDCLGEIDLLPPGIAHLAGAAGCQNGKFQRPGGDRVSGTKLRHEIRNLLISQRRVMAAREHVLGFASRFWRWPRQRAGFSPVLSRALWLHQGPSRCGPEDAWRSRAIVPRSAAAPSAPPRYRPYRPEGRGSGRSRW